MKPFQILKEPKFSNNLERDYALNAMSRRERNTARLFFLLASVAWVPPLLAQEFGFINSPEHLIIIVYSLVQSVAAILMLLKRPSIKTEQRSIFTMMLLGQIAWTAAALVDLRDGRGSMVLGGLWIAYMFLGNLLMPLKSWAHNVVAAVSLPTAAYAFWFFDNPDIGIILTACALLIGQNVQIFSQRLLTLDAIRTFRAKSKYIPRQVLMNAVQNDVSILNVFSPADRFCVCICSDWTNMMQATKQIPLSTIGKSLGSYYEQVVTLLSQSFTDGRFFVDWIADELFIVVFADNEQPDPNMVRMSFEFCVKILDLREEFARAHGFPAAVQIGLTAGTASVGVFGSGGIAKATAFGSTPGKARRLQQLGKRIGRLEMASDRIVMNSEFTEMLGLVRTTFSPVALGGNLTIKDIQADRVFVWPPIEPQREFEAIKEAPELRKLVKSS